MSTKSVVTTQVLLCNAAAISFPIADDAQPMVSEPDTLAALQTAADDLIHLRVPVVFPTETVYGLAASALDISATAQIFSIKGRPADNPLIVHVSSLAMLHSLLPSSFIMPPTYQALMNAFWPGPLTLLFPASPKIPSIITAGRDTVAIRMPSHPIARALIMLAKTPLAAPSANISGSPSPTKASHVARNLDGKVRIILDGGPCHVGIESTVVDGLHPDGRLRVLRPGGITVEAIERIVASTPSIPSPKPNVLVYRRDYTDVALEDAPTTPGMKYRHYSPSVPVILFMTSPPSAPKTDRASLPAALSRILSSYPSHKSVQLGLLTPSNSPLSLLPCSFPFHADVPIEWHAFPLGMTDDLATTARRLFEGLLTLEERGVDLIIVEGVEERNEGLAIMNRMRKAAGEVIWVNLEDKAG